MVLYQIQQELHGDLENTEEKVEEANEQIDELKYDTNKEGLFNIECIYDSGLVVEVKITEIDEE